MKLPLLLSLLPTLAFAAPDTKPAGGSIAAPDAAVDSSVVARVGESEVKLDELKAHLAKLDIKDQAALARDPALLNQVVRLMMVQRLMLREATANKWHEQPQVKAQVERAREATIAESYLAKMSAPPAEYPTEAELMATYEAVKPSISSPKQWKLAQIYIAAPEGISKEDLDKAQAKLDAVKKALEAKDADFAAIASKNSDEKQSAAQGGEIGWMAEAQIQPEIRTEATLLGEGKTSHAVRLKDGWHILKCTAVREAFTPAFEEVRAQLAEKMREEKTKANSQAYMAKLLKENPLAVNEIVLSKAVNEEKK